MAFKRLIEVSSGPAGGFGKQINDLRMSFEVNKTDQKSPNTAKITIYNLSRSSANEMGRIKNKVIIRAGYEDEGGLKSLFFGDLTRSNFKKSGTETMLEIEAVDGRLNLSETIISIGLAGDTPVQTVVEQILRFFTIPLAAPLNLPRKLYKYGYSFIGKAKDALTEALRYVGYFWTIINEQLFIFQDGRSLSRSGLFLTPTTGLINIPETLTDSDKQTDPSEAPTRWKVTCLLFPQLSPGAEFEIQSKVLSAGLTVESSSFKGDNYEGDFITVVEARVR